MSDNVITATAPLQRKEKTLAGKSQYSFRRNNFVGFLFISPWLIGFILFSVIPIGASLILAFTDYNLLRAEGEFIGLDNFERMFYEDARYWKAVKATFRYVAFSVPLRLIFALIVAMLLNTGRRGVFFYRAAFYTPSIVGGSVAVAVLWR
ncbi:MAG: sugar ABC transporter permease, partial [Anaerolineae bacterium]|nr:sugar ABC transporter permease [Anaerolineae bacterium]